MEPERNMMDERPSSLNLEQETVKANKPLVAPRVLTGPASAYNQGAIDWCEFLFLLIFDDAPFAYMSVLSHAHCYYVSGAGTGF